MADKSSPDIPPRRYFRKVIRIKAEDSPNVRYAQAQLSRGLRPTNEVLVPGVLEYPEYRRRRRTWDKVRQCIGLDAEFYEGSELLLFPPDWLNRCEEWADYLKREKTHRVAKAMGVDPAEGGDKTSMTVIDELGIIDRISRKTPDTSDIPNEALALMLKYNIPPHRVGFDQGGGGKQAADTLRRKGYPVRTIPFGAAIASEPRRGILRLAERKEIYEERYVYKNRRAQMYGDLSELLDPSLWEEGEGFGIPREFPEFRQQLAPIPKTYDGEGRLELPPKNRRGLDPENSKKKTLVEIIGHSPDEVDSLVLAVHVMLYSTKTYTAGAIPQ